MAGELQQLAQQFADDFDMHDPQFDAQGRCHFLVDTQMELSVLQNGDQLIIEASLGELPEQEDEAETLLARCLRQQLGKMKDAREVLCIDTDDQVCLYRRLSARRTSRSDFSDAISDFVNTLEFWLLFIGQIHKQTAMPAVSPMMTLVRP